MDHLFNWFNLGFVLGLLLFIAALAVFFRRAGEVLDKERAARRTLITTAVMGALLSSYLGAFAAVAFGGVLGGSIGDAMARSFSLSCEVTTFFITTGIIVGIAVVFGFSLLVGAFAFITCTIPFFRKNGNWYR